MLEAYPASGITVGITVNATSALVSSVAGFEADVKQDYADTDPEDTTTKAKLDTIDDLLEDPEVKTILLERMDAAD